MSFVDDLLIILSSYSGGYRLMRARIQGSTWQPRGASSHSLRNAPDATIRVILSRLKTKGYVENKEGIWKITKVGRDYLAGKLSTSPAHSKKVAGRKEKSIVISFDIPETHKKKRDWLRAELACLGFEMLHKSVWLGPAPLPREFVDSLRTLQLLSYLKFFEAREANIV